MSDSTFHPDKPVTFAQARRGEVIAVQGYGKSPRVWRPSTNTFKPSGMVAPETAPEIKIYNIEGDVRPTEASDSQTLESLMADWYEGITSYVARIDIIDAGGNIDLPPVVLIETPVTINDLVAIRAEAVSRIAQKQLSQIEVTTFGRHYSGSSNPPDVFLNGVGADPNENNTGGTGRELEIETGQDPDDPTKVVVTAVKLINGGSGFSEGSYKADAGGEPQTTGNPPNFQLIQDYPTSPRVLGRLQVTVNSDGVVTEIDLPAGYDVTARRNPEITWSQVRSNIDTDNSINYGQAQAITRATFRGKYQCYYRFVNDSIPEDEGGPLYSNLSPLTEIDTKHGAAYITWTMPNPSDWDGRKIELWRSSSNQSTTLYHVATIAEDSEASVLLTKTDSSFTWLDDLNDNELTDAKREAGDVYEVDGTVDFSALPILLPNGELNANRFGVMSPDFAVAVMFQDRLWYSVDSTNKRPNSLMFSETDEPESCPDINELIIQQNLRSADYITALIPYAGALIACQSRHCHRLTYVSQPLIDVATFLIAYRGCASQRCWDLYEGIAYIMDEFGVYSLDPQGKVEPLTVGIDNIFCEHIDWSKKKWFIVRADRKLNILRCAVSYYGDEGDYPTRQLCYSLDYKAWWMEVYPSTVISSTDFRDADGTVERMWGGSNKKVYRLGETLVDDAEGAITGVMITEPGRGYKQPPEIKATGGSCASFSCSLDSDGQIVGIQIRQCGTGYDKDGGVLEISAPEEGGQQAEAIYTTTTGECPVYYSMLSGNMEFTTDTQDPKAAYSMNRQVSLVYKPTEESSVLSLEAYYNGAKYPRSNVVTRDRGTGFVHSEEVPAAVLDMKATQAQSSEAHGVARAVFAGRTLDDMSGTDRHIAIGLSGKQDDSGQVTIHSVDVYGVNPSS